ncbi:MAG: extracellular solute-binding protein [Actinobacteria bacterium]|nr:extracellular solute-binding protein [Actinomycetota bacterium]
MNLAAVRPRHPQLVLLSAAVLVTVAACGAPTQQGGTAKNQADSLNALYQRAKAEGSVSFWGPEDPPDIVKLGAAFNKTYPGIKVKPFEITATDMVPKMIAAAQAGQTTTDIAEGSLSTIQPLVQHKLLAKFQNWGKLLKLPQGAILENGAALAWYNNLQPIAFNTNLVSAQDEPKTWNDLLDPKWKGKILVESRAMAFSVLGMQEGDAKMVDYLKKLKAQDLKFVDGGTTTLQELAAGTGAIAVGAYAYNIDNYRDQKKAPVDWNAPNPVGASQFVLFSVANAPHPAAAQLFMDWLASPRGLAANKNISGHSSILQGSGSSEAARVQQQGATMVVETPANTDLRGKEQESAAAALGTASK